MLIYNKFGKKRILNHTDCETIKIIKISSHCSILWRAPEVLHSVQSMAGRIYKIIRCCFYIKRGTSNPNGHFFVFFHFLTNMSQPVNEYDLIIVGAGVVGCAAAKAFGEDGRKVLLLERDLSEPDRIVGELMQPGGIQALKALGMEGTVFSSDLQNRN